MEMFHIYVSLCALSYPGSQLRKLQSPAHAGSSLADFSTLKMEVMHSYETSVHTRTQKTALFKFPSCFLVLCKDLLL
jgi:hypothetical protein